MRAIVFDKELKFIKDYPKPNLLPQWALIRVLAAGICGTDLEILKGYKQFSGIIGHEFVGIVQECDEDQWRGKRVVGDINISCGYCSYCIKGMKTHCINRRVLGMINHDGCLAEFCTLPIQNLHEVPAHISNDRAVFIEPLSAATRILSQFPIDGKESAIILGDGKVGILCAWVLSTVLSDVTLVGHHRFKLEIAKWNHIHTVQDLSEIFSSADIVVDATGTPTGIMDAIRVCKAGGTIVLKSTVTTSAPLNLTPIVVNEHKIIGSRCGNFKEGIQILSNYPDMPIEKLITARYSLNEGLRSIHVATNRNSLKIIVDMD